MIPSSRSACKTVLDVKLLFYQLAFIIAIIAFSIAKRRIDNATDGALKGSLGNGIWMSLAAAVSRAFPPYNITLET